MPTAVDFAMVQPYYHTGPLFLVSEETISGVRAVHISQSGYLRIAMAGVSGRMPAIGVVIDNVVSGDIPYAVYAQGIYQFSSGMGNFSGYLGKGVYVGRSGQLVQFNASWNSGGFSLTVGGDFVQRVGVAINSGGFILNVHPYMTQAKTLPLTELTDSADLGLSL